jgi:hypothetical protein
MLYHGQQLAIGEIMSVTEEGGELVCMGYSMFVRKFKDKEDNAFRSCFDRSRMASTRLWLPMTAINRCLANGLRSWRFY